MRGSTAAASLLLSSLSFACFPWCEHPELNCDHKESNLLEGKYGKSLRGQGETVVGSVDDYLQELAYYHTDLRIDSFIFWPPEEGKEVDQVSLFADKVVPRVKESLDR